VTRIVTDTAADLPRSLVDSAGITVARGSVRFGEREWQGEAERFWSEVGRGPNLPATEAPSAAELAAAYRGDDPVLAVHVSGELSRTLAHAAQAAGTVDAAVRVTDSRSISVGTGLVALAAAQAAQAGVEGDRLAEMTERWVDQLHVHAVIDDVTFLVRGGRAGLVAAKVDKHAHRHVIAVKGHVIPIRQVRHRAEAIHELIDHVTDHVGSGINRWAVGHGDAPDVEQFVGRLEAIFACEPAYITLLGAPVGSHLGPRSLVVSFLSDA
jgi:fatty acid kinase fatty acid binding subunit